MTADQLLDAVEKDSMERLRWLVLSRFNILPGSKQARELSKEDIIVSGAHMVLDRRPRRRETDAETGGNASFREERFLKLCRDAPESSEDGL